MRPLVFALIIFFACAFEASAALDLSYEDGELVLGIDCESYQLETLQRPAKIVVRTRSTITDRRWEFDGRPITEIEARNEGAGSLVVIRMTQYLPPSESFDEIDGRLTLRVSERFVRISRKRLGRGLDVLDVGLGTPDGPVTTHVLRMADDEVERLGIVLGEDYDRARLQVSQLKEDPAVLAAVNGSYFSPRGETLSLIVREGEVVFPPNFDRPLWGVREDGGFFVGYAPVRASITSTGGGSITVESINTPPGAKEPMLFTPEHPVRIRGSLHAVKLVIHEGRVEAITTGDLPNWKGRTIVAVTSPGMLKGFKEGQPVEIKYEILLEGSPLKTAMGGGPLLVKDGRAGPTVERDDIPADIANGRNPRTSIAVGEGRIMLAVTDGRSSGYSVGVSLKGLARLLAVLGAQQALNLDGGQSSLMVGGDGYLSFPAGGNERWVDNAIAVRDVK